MKTIHKWQLVIEKAAQKEFDKLAHKDKVRVFDSLKTLLCADNPLRVPGVEKYQAECGTWKIRQGDYRIMFCLTTLNAEVTFSTCKGQLVLKHVALHHNGYK